MNRITLLKKLDGWIGPLLVRLFSVLPVSQTPVTELSRVLFIRPGGIGDAVLLVPTLQVLKSSCPEVKIDVLAERRNHKAFSLTTVIENVYCYDQPIELLRTMRNEYDVVVDTEQWHRLSALIARMVRCRRRIGFATNERARLFSDALDYSHVDYEADSFLKLLAPLSIGAGFSYSSSFLSLSDMVCRSDELFSGLASPYVVLFPGASIEERKWGAGRFAELARRIATEGNSVVVVGGAEDVEVGEYIAANSAAINMAGRTSLQETASILQDAALLVGGDSGILHIAVGFGVSTVSLFGPGIADKWAPRGDGHIVINHALICSPCTMFGYTPKCEIGARCIQDISVDEVFAAACKLLP